MAFEEKVNYLRFNQHHQCFICCLDSGVRLYSIDPLNILWKRSAAQFGSIGNGAMMYHCNYIAVVGGGAIPKFADNVVLIYDEKVKRFIREMTFCTPVLGARLELQRLLVIESHKIHVFPFPNDMEKRMFVYETNNPLGLGEMVKVSADKFMICFPGQKKGSVQLADVSSSELNVSQSPILINAHENSIACLSFNRDGHFMATASSKGTLIRVWDTSKRTKIHELRRGSDPATLYCINFSGDSDFLCCSSDKGTVHIYALKDPRLNRGSAFSQVGIGGFLGGYIESQWALATFTAPSERPCICAFGPNSRVYAVCYDGSLHTYRFTTEGSCTREFYDIFLDEGADDGF